MTYVHDVLFTIHDTMTTCNIYFMLTKRSPF